MEHLMKQFMSQKIACGFAMLALSLIFVSGCAKKAVGAKPASASATSAQAAPPNPVVVQRVNIERVLQLDKGTSRT
jgi:hypothetical protein